MLTKPQRVIMEQRKYAGKWLAEIVAGWLPAGIQPTNANLAKVMANCRRPRDDEYGAIRWAIVHLADDEPVPASVPAEFEQEPDERPTMTSLADFRRLAVAGSRWHCTNRLHPNANGLRVVTSGVRVLKYTGTRADGVVITVGRLELPQADAVRFEGDSIHFLYSTDDDRIAFSWRLMKEDL